MSKKSNTAGKTAKKNSTNRIHLKCGLVFTDKKDRVVIEIVDKAFANLHEIADILNGLYDNDEKTTPAEVVKDFLCWGDAWFNLDTKQCDKWDQNLCGDIVQSCTDEFAPQVESAFNAAGFDVRA